MNGSVPTVEMFSARDSGQFQINGAVMMVGGTSVNRWKSDKISMRLSFDIEYGQGKLKFPVFDNGVESFNSLTIDAGLNNTWHYGGGVDIKDTGDLLSQNDIAQYTRESSDELFINSSLIISCNFTNVIRAWSSVNLKKST